MTLDGNTSKLIAALQCSFALLKLGHDGIVDLTEFVGNNISMMFFVV